MPPEPTDTLVDLVLEDGPADTPPDALYPARLADRYEILALLGAGGMGTVYEVRDLELDEVVALKLLKPELLEAPGILDRFRQEVRLARRVTHPNVVRTFDLGEHCGQRFLTMELVKGTSLGQRLADGPLNLGETLRIARALCAGVGAAHAAGVLHRDLKPDNILLGCDGRVAVSDFGVARAWSTDGQTRAQVVGTPAYMAPEQVRGESVDGRADVYAIGAILFELLTGRRAWRGDAVFAVALARLENPPPDPRSLRPEIPEAIAALVLRAMARHPADRFASAEALAGALDALDEPAEPVHTPVPPPRASAPAAHARSVAVLPFRAADPEDAYLSEGAAEEIVDVLAMTPGLRVRPFAKAPDDDPVRAGQALGVEVVVDGSVRRLGDSLRITVRLVHVADGFQIWARRFECPPQEALVTLDGVSRALAGALTTELDLPERSVPTDPRAVDLYLRGRHALRQGWHGATAEAVSLLEEALRIAPTDPTILAACAMGHARRAYIAGDPGGVQFVRAVAAAEHAVAMAPEKGDTWLALGVIRLHQADHGDAARAFDEAARRSPSLEEAHQQLGSLLLEAGAAEEGLKRLQIAQMLHPSRVQTRLEMARGYALSGRWDEAEALLGSPAPHAGGEFGRLIVGCRVGLWRTGRPPEVVLPSEGLGPGSFAARGAERYLRLVRRHADPDFVAQVQAFFNERPEGTSLRLLAVIDQMCAELFGLVGAVEEAEAAIRQAVEDGLVDLFWLDRCPLLEPLRGRPRWAEAREIVHRRADKVLKVLHRA